MTCLGEGLSFIYCTGHSSEPFKAGGSYPSVLEIFLIILHFSLLSFMKLLLVRY